MKSDKSLIRHISKEEYKGYEISYGISRFGNLFVCVNNKEHICRYTTDNILDAREAIDNGFKGKVSKPLVQFA